ncbi:MAG: hypothetical protein JW699_04040 [Chitinispirillaceae bacterium]|nr:hypothetical protein [Chitinispirillaceae bacterium]
MGHRRTSVLLTALAAMCATAAPGPKALSGGLSGSFPAAEYTVAGNAVVPHRKTVSFEAGSILRFENFSGITVHGTLICKGTPSRPVIFTSINDAPASGAMPEPFDWNGIKAAPDAAHVALEHCIVTYSTYGINIESTATPVVLTNVSFHHNGTSSFTIEKKMTQVTENLPLSYDGSKSREGLRTAKNGTKETGEPLTGPNRAVEEPAWKKPARISCAAAAAGGAVLWLTGFLCAGHYNSLITPETPSAQAREYKESWNSWVKVRNTGIGILGLGAAGYAVTFAF